MKNSCREIWATNRAPGKTRPMVQNPAQPFFFEIPPINLHSPFLPFLTMSEDVSRYLGYNDIRQLQDVGQKAAMLCLKYRVPQRAAAEALKVSRGLVRRAVDAVNKGRNIGTNGRPRILSSDEEAKLIDMACKKADEHQALTASQLTIEVCPSFLHC